jgi:Carboxypeptidase regulatory-like domain/TonB dependent receptor
MTAIRVLLGVLFTSIAAWAQTAQISGTVRDATGAVVPGAAIKATQTATGVVRTTNSGADGGYVLPNLPIGPYMVEVTKEGFSRFVQMGIVLEVATNPTLDFSMKVGAVSEQVTVEATTLQVETRTNSIGQVVDNARIMEMPLNGRDVHQLIFLAGMANFPGNNSLQSVRNYPTVVVSVAGGLPDSVGYSLDGIVHQDPYNNLSLPLPFPDAVQEFKVEWSAAPAQYGYHSTATVNAVTKSGTNQYHGDLFEFLRNGNLNANDFFSNAAGRPRDTYKRNQFGGVIGGPIEKDKLFFFGGYQRTSLRSDGTAATAFIPTSAMAQGDFSSIKTPLPAALGFTGSNQIPVTSLNPVALNILKTIPATADPTGRTFYSSIGNQDENLFTGRIDYQVNSKHQLYGRVLYAKLSQSSSFDGKNPLTIANYGLDDLVYGVALGDTWVVSPTLVSSLRIGANRTDIAKVPDLYKSYKDLGANVSELGGKNIALTVTGFFTIGGGGAAPGESHNGPLWSINEDLNWVKGAHQIGFGGGIYRQALNYWSGGGVNATGLATFDNSGATSNALVNFMLGLPTSWSQGTLYGYYSRQYYGALYVQDNWKISRRLTLNYGVRWEPYTAVYQKYSHQALHFDPALFTQNVRSSYYQNAPAGLVFAGDPQYSCGNYFNCPKWNKFFPRVGLAWDPQGDGRMTIRVGYGMFGDRMSMLSLSQEQFGAPFGNTVSVSGANIADPWAKYPGGAGGLLPAGQNPMAILAARSGFGNVAANIPFVTFGSYISSPLSDFKPTYVNQYNLSIQKQLSNDWLLSANFLGTGTIHMVSGTNLNPAIYIPGTTATANGCPVIPGSGTYPLSCVANQNFRRPLYQQSPALGQYYSGIGLVDDGGTATYHGMNLSAQKRLSHGINLLANYTWSHCISDQWFQNPTAGNGNSIPGDRRKWRGNCQGIDLRHLFELSMVATTPKFSNRTARWLASDWQFAPSLEIKSAQFFTIVTGSDVALTTTINQTPNQLMANPYPANQSVDKWLVSTAPSIRADLRDTSPAFANAATGTYGNLGYNNLKGPGVFQLNMALSRNFALREGLNLQVRGEAFNLPNHLNAGTPGGVSPVNFGGIATLSAPNFGQITNDISSTNGGLIPGDYRVVQLAMKLIF